MNGGRFGRGRTDGLDWQSHARVELSGNSLSNDRRLGRLHDEQEPGADFWRTNRCRSKEKRARVCGPFSFSPRRLDIGSFGYSISFAQAAIKSARAKFWRSKVRRSINSKEPYAKAFLLTTILLRHAMISESANFLPACATRSSSKTLTPCALRP